MATVDLIRMRNAAVAAKIETTIGTDVIAGSPSSSDFIGAEVQVQFAQNAIPDPSYTGTLDDAVPIVGGLRSSLRLTMPLRGSGAAGTAPEFGRLLQACTWAETVTGTAVGAPTALTAGSTTTATLQTPFGNTAQQYRGMPLTLSGDQAITTGIMNYTSGRVATFGDTLGTGAGTSTSAQIPVNVLYAPTSDESVTKTLTIYCYYDGLLLKFTGCAGSWSLELPTGGIGNLSFDLVGTLVAAPSTASVPSAALGITRQTPPRFVAGRLQLNKGPAQTRSLSINAGVTTILPDDPEASEGTGAALATKRAIGGSLDPYMNTTLTPARFAAFQAGTLVTLEAIIGSTAGNRFLLTLPAIRKTAMNPQARDNLGVDAITFQASGADSGLYFAQF